MLWLQFRVYRWLIHKSVTPQSPPGLQKFKGENKKNFIFLGSPVCLRVTLRFFVAAAPDLTRFARYAGSPISVTFPSRPIVCYCRRGGAHKPQRGTPKTEFSSGNVSKNVLLHDVASVRREWEHRSKKKRRHYARETSEETTNLTPWSDLPFCQSL